MFNNNEDIFNLNFRPPQNAMMRPNLLAQYIQDPTSHSYDQILILDARLPSQFSHGHINGAINITSFAQILNVYNACINQRTCVICYCEYSNNRSPSVYLKIRHYDRENHINEYPKLTIPDLYVLEGGYNSFIHQYKELCVGNWN